MELNFSKGCAGGGGGGAGKEQLIDRIVSNISSKGIN